MNKSVRSSSAGKVSAHRERMRQQGLRPLQFWVPDLRSPAVRAEIRRQSLRIAASREEGEIMDFIEAVADTSGWS